MKEVTFFDGFINGFFSVFIPMVMGLLIFLVAIPYMVSIEIYQTYIDIHITRFGFGMIGALIILLLINKNIENEN